MISKVVITGGPCAGKTSSLNHIKKSLTSAGIKTVIIPEVSTILMLGFGISPIDNPIEFQKMLLRTQIAYEDNVKKYLQGLGQTNACIICDRGALDFKAYMESDMVAEVLQELTINETELLERYDKVIHLVSTAVDLPTAYTTQNNQARLETVEQAKELDIRTQNAWLGHNYHVVIDNSTSFDDKLRRVLDEILSLAEPCIGDLIPLGKDKAKILITKQEAMELIVNNNLSKTSIVQFYLKEVGVGVTSKIRYFNYHGYSSYTHNLKLNDGRTYTVPISAAQFANHMLDIDDTCAPVKKSRFYGTRDNIVYYIDIFKDLNFAIVEVAQKDKDELGKFFNPVEIKGLSIQKLNNLYIAKHLEELKNAEIICGGM